MNLDTNAPPEEGWRYLVYRLDSVNGTEALIHPEATLEGVQISDVLSGPPTLTATVDPFSYHEKAFDGKPVYLDWKTTIFAEKDGEIRGGGMLVDSAWNGTAYSLTIAGYTSYPAGQPYIGPGEMHVQIDLCDAFRRVWNYLQGMPGGNIGLEIDQTTISAIKIGTKLEQVDFTTGTGEQVSFEAGPWKLSWHSTDDLGRVIDDLTKQGFEYRERHSWRNGSGSSIRHRVDLWAPGSPAGGGTPLIRRRDDVRIVIEENAVEIPTMDRNSESYASAVQGLGAGDGPTTVRAIINEPDPLGRVFRARNVADSSLRSKSGVTGLAKRTLDASRGDWEVTSIAIRDSELLPVASVQPGDELLLVGEIGGFWFEDYIRVVSTTITPDDIDGMTLTVIRHDKLEEST